MDSASTANRPLATTPRDCKAKVAVNPLDWTAVPFLAFYVIVAASAFAAVFVRRRSLISAGDAGDDAKTNFIELAYLAGGKQRAADAVLVAFLAAGAATLDAKQQIFWLENPSIILPRELERFRVRDAVSTRQSFHDAIARQLDDIYCGLSRLGLAPSPDTLTRLRRDTIRIMAIPIVLGLAKIIIGGIIRHHPVGILIGLIVITGLLGWRLLGRPPSRTRLGAAMVKRVSLYHARAARAPLRSEMAFAFAIAGPVVLMDTPYSALGLRVQTNNAGSGGDGAWSSGSCGGGGAGDGGGGGCGGCGGGH